MGRIKTTPVKRITKKLYATHREEFSASFEENKKSIGKFIEGSSKPIRNKIAGYMARLVKKESEPRERRAPRLPDQER
ncbi:30S ribosomal protein S17e [Candidatus Woesearchaeota archaeon]|nr:30S ribosomal protein S17e [Candidatus Woesearchaeota archaeon]